MNKETSTLKIIDGIYDIQPLTEPAFSLLEKILISFSFISLISLTLYFIWKSFYSKKAIARRKIKKLYKLYSQNNIKKHDAIFELCDLTKQGLGVKNLNDDILLPEKSKENIQHWETFLSNLSLLRYKKPTINHNSIDQIFHDCLYWIKIWP